MKLSHAFGVRAPRKGARFGTCVNKDRHMRLRMDNLTILCTQGGCRWIIVSSAAVLHDMRNESYCHTEFLKMTCNDLDLFMHILIEIHIVIQHYVLLFNIVEDGLRKRSRVHLPFGTSTTTDAHMHVRWSHGRQRRRKEDEAMAATMQVYLVNAFLSSRCFVDMLVVVYALFSLLLF